MAEAHGATLYGKRDFSRTKQDYEGDHVQSSTRTLLSSSCLHVRQKDSKFREVCLSRESHDASRKNKSFVQRLLRITVCLLSTPLLKSTSTARWVTSAHGRALTIIAESQHPSTPMWASVFKNTCVEVFTKSCSHNFQWPSGY